MIYKILVKGAAGLQYATHKVEIKEKVIENDEIVEVGTGKYRTEVFTTEDKNTVKTKFLELLKQYRVDELDVVADMQEVVTVSIEIPEPNEPETNPNPDNGPEDNEPDDNETPGSDDESGEDEGDGDNNETPTPSEPSDTPSGSDEEEPDEEGEEPTA